MCVRLDFLFSKSSGVQIGIFLDLTTGEGGWTIHNIGFHETPMIWFYDPRKRAGHPIEVV